MNAEPRFEGDYSERQTTAARRVLVDVGQILAAFQECVVVVGGWVPDLLFREPTEQHVKSIDVDLALDAKKLTDGQMVKGARNTVELRVAALPDFLVMKCYALKGRDKPKDAYDICFCLDQVPDGGAEIAQVWKTFRQNEDVATALKILRSKFGGAEDYGARQVVEFHQAPDAAERAIQAQRAYRLVQRFLDFVADETSR